MLVINTSLFSNFGSVYLIISILQLIIIIVCAVIIYKSKQHVVQLKDKLDANELTYSRYLRTIKRLEAEIKHLENKEITKEHSEAKQFSNTD